MSEEIDSIIEGTMEITLETSNPGEAPPVLQADPLASIPKIFCVDKEIGKKILIDLFAVMGALNAIRMGNVDPNTTKLVLNNATVILSNLGDILIRDCEITDAELEEVQKVFTEEIEKSNEVASAQGCYPTQ